ncbi:MAG: hypothetical protein KC609_12425, partial [Myxococcales bacterium]|nr:hypothetical protein [Myxococcales bacterium]
MRVQRPATARFLVAIVVYGVVGLVALPDLRAARKGEVELAIHLAPRYPFWEPGTIRLSVHNRGKTAILIDSIRFVCGTLHLERQKSVPVRIDRDGSGLLVHSGIVRPKVAPTPRRRPLLSPPHLGTLSARRALFLRGGGTFFESWRPVLTHLASPQLTVLLRYRRIVGKKPLLYVPSGVPKRIEGGAFVVRYEPRERPTSGLVVVDEPTPVWNAALMHSETSATLTLELPSFSFEAAQRKLRDLSTKYRVGYWLAEKMWA